MSRQPLSAQAMGPITVKCNSDITIGPAETPAEVASGSLLAAAAAGSEEAWAALVDRYTGLLWAVARSFRLGEASSADVVQTAWLRLAENLDRLRDPDRVGAWLATTARREALRMLNRRAKESPMDLVGDLERVSEAGGPECDALAEDRDARVRRAFVRLPQRDQQLLRLLMASPPPSYLDVSAAMDMPVGSIGPTRARCLARLRRELAAVGLDTESAGV